MNPDRSVAILQRQIGIIPELMQKTSSSDASFVKWRRDTEVAIERIFGDSSRHGADFKKIKYTLSIVSSSTPREAFVRAYRDGLGKAEAVLRSIVDEINEYEIEEDQSSSAPDHLNLIERICLRFHAVCRQIRDRHSGRPTIEVEDEYDVQDLIHALLRIHFDDIRAEEWTPSYAGGASRVDFLLKEECIVIEVKKTRGSMNVADLGAQLLVDIARYERHPDCRTLVCFVYDPEARIGNPVGLERDLEARSGALKVRAIVGPKA